MIRQPGKTVKKFFSERLFGDRSCPSNLTMECTDQNKIQTNSSVWRFSKGIPLNKNPGRRT